MIVGATFQLKIPRDFILIYEEVRRFGSIPFDGSERKIAISSREIDELGLKNLPVNSGRSAP
jgi:hypothetical protein